MLEDQGVLLLEPEAPLTADDFAAVSRDVDPWIEKQGQLQGIVIRAHAFPGWDDLAGLLSHVRFVRDHHRKVRRVALAVDAALLDLAASVTRHFVAAEVKRFHYDELEEALAWAGRGTH